MARAVFRLFTFVCTFALFACADTNTISDVPSYDRRATDERVRMPAQAHANGKKVVGELRHFSRYAVDVD